MKGQLVLLVAPDPLMLRHLRCLLCGWGYEPVPTPNVDDAIDALTHHRFLFTLLDLGLRGSEGPEFFRRLGARAGDTGPVLVLCEERDSEGTLQGFGPQAAHLVRKPLTAEELEAAIQKVLARPRRLGSRMTEEDLRLRQEIALWRSPKMREVWEIVQQAASVDVTVLICGETGTGKDVVARGIHHLSSRQGQPFVKVNCAAVPRELLESELFGHERGAFTGAHQLKIGKFESANHGTVLLDEIGDLHPALQAKLLHVLQDGTFSRVGGRSTIKVDIHVLAATNQDLERAVLEGRFREDLYYRLNVIQILVPPLRERIEEIPLLAEYFIDRYSKLFRRQGFRPAPRVMERLVHYRYPGNVRELENIIKRMIVLNDPLLARIALPARGADSETDDAPETSSIGVLSLKEVARTAARAAERQAIARVLEETRWNRVKAAKLLKISYRALLYKIRDAGLSGNASPPPSAHPLPTPGRVAPMWPRPGRDIS